MTLAQRIARRVDQDLPPAEFTEQLQAALDALGVRDPQEPEYWPAPKAHPNTMWMIVYEDADAKPRIFTNEEAARKTYAQNSVNWNCHLFRGVESNHA